MLGRIEPRDMPSLAELTGEAERPDRAEADLARQAHNVRLWRAVINRMDRKE